MLSEIRDSIEYQNWYDDVVCDCQHPVVLQITNIHKFQVKESMSGDGASIT